MFGKIIGELAALPVRVVNIPVRVAERVLDTEIVGEKIESIAEAFEESVSEAIDGSDRA